MAYTPGRMVWEAVFLLLVLKIPVVYLCLVVWWAIRSEPRPEAPAALVPVEDTPPHVPLRTVGHRRGRRPTGDRPARRPPTVPRLASLRAERRR